MRHIGILGHSAEGASLCFLAACHEAEARLGALLHPDITLTIAPLAYSMEHWEQMNLAAVRAILAGSVRRLAAAGADFFVCPDNTAHLALEAPGPDLALPGLHIADIAAGAAARREFACLGLLGTRWTMGGAAYANAFARHGLDYRLPPPDEREVINAIIFDELVRGIFSDASRRRVAGMIAALKAQGCDAVALSCTEIPLLIGDADSPLPIIDSTRLLAKAAVDVALGEASAPSWRGGAIA